MDAGRAMGIGRWTVVVGILCVEFGSGFDARFAWVGVGLTVLGLATNTAGKVSGYRELSMRPRQRLLVLGSWGALAVALAGLVADYAYAREVAAYDGFFWSILLTTAGLAAVHWGLRRKHVPFDPGANERG